ncbi:MAG: hypothetical protein QNK37_10735 [Acidobacteriota bacterium]|nr:hypothetical protein [Acidobacteriota bacterium]
MTILIINGKETHDILTHEGQSVLDILLAAQDKYWGPETSIESMLVDGNAVEPLNEESLGAMPAGGKRIEIVLQTPEPRSLKETLAEASAYLARLETGFEELSNRIRNQGDTTAYTMLHDGMEGLSQIIGLFSVIQKTQTLPEDMAEDFKGLIESLSEKSEEMTDAQESRDPTLIADILEYEFVESVQELRGYLERIRSQLTD